MKNYEQEREIEDEENSCFNSVTLDGYFTDAKGDMGWAHKNDPEWNSLVEDNAKAEAHYCLAESRTR